MVSGPYPIVVADSRGINVVLSSGKFGQFVGRLDLHFDDLGMLRFWDGNPIYIDNRYQSGKCRGILYGSHVLSEAYNYLKFFLLLLILKSSIFLQLISNLIRKYWVGGVEVK